MQDTTCTLTIRASTAQLVSDNSRERAAWMAQFGKAADAYVEVTLTADADAWVKAGCIINVDGTVRNPKNCTGCGIADYPSNLGDDLCDFLRGIVARDGQLVAAYDATPMLERRAAKIAEDKACETRNAEANAARRDREAAAASAREAAKVEAEAKARDEILAWIAEFGSPRLRRCAGEGIECGAAYRDERLRAERPGWQWDDDGEDHAPRNPPITAFRMLDEARKTAPHAKLSYLVIDEKTNDDGVVVASEWRGYVAQDRFIGYGIRFGVPEAPAEH